MLEFEKQYLAQNYSFIAGMDEAGRGPLAGPVACACVIMPLDKESIIEGVDDSKKLSAKKRDLLYDKIISTAIAYKVVLIDEKQIDKVNILNATKQGMQECVMGLTVLPDIVLIDAVKLNLPVKIHSIIHGDALSYSIACASILAKVTRDRFMEEQDALYPQYNFKQHKGYGTKLHIQNLKQYGPCEIHRRSFIKNFVK